MQNQQKNMWRRSLNELKNTRALTVCAMLLAVRILLGFVATIYVTPQINISFGFLPLAVMAYLYGPVPAMINAGLADIISYLLKPMGAFHPGFTLTSALGGLIYGLFFYRKQITARRVTLAKLLVDVFCNILLNTFWLHQMYGNGFLALLPARVAKNMFQLPVDVALVMMMFASLAPVFKSLGRAMPADEQTKVRDRKLVRAAVCLAWALVALWINNTSLLVKAPYNDPKWLAHRGMAQTFPIDDVKWDTDTSKIIYPPEHEYLENTLPSMARAFELGADCVELDLRRTKDDKLAVFHDDLLEYRTDGTGYVYDMTMADMKKLDAGYGYTADGGATFPFRGKGVGMIPEFSEVLSEFYGKDLLVHVKSGDQRTAELVWEAVMGLEPEEMARLSFYGGNEAISYLRLMSDELRLMSTGTLKSALIQYELLGWSGYIPPAMQHAQIHIPERYAKFLWGWPARFMQRMDSVDTHVVLVAGDGDWSRGFDDVESLRRIQDSYSGYIWTNRIDLVGGKK